MAFLIYEVPIGSEFSYKGTSYEVIESSGATYKGCSFQHDEELCDEFPFYCTKENRCDGKNVIFKQIIQNK